jgi:hypothetical protein
VPFASRLAAITPVSADVPPNTDPAIGYGTICNIAAARVPMWYAYLPLRFYLLYCLFAKHN